MKILLAIDSFKGCLSSEEVEATFAQHLTGDGIETFSFPMSDGGEGMLNAFATALHARTVEVSVHDPLMRPITAQYGINPDGTAIIETAQACGLTLMCPEERNPMTATTYGVGELIADALYRGCRNFIIGLGGSGTSDAGMGMVKALTDRGILNGATKTVCKNDLMNCSFTLACDVRNPLYGPHGAAQVFARQKGATEEMIEALDLQARRFAEESANRLGKDQSHEPGAGAAGGLGYAFLEYLPSTMKSGADLLLDLIGFDRFVKEADLIITGEGSADRQTLMGKLPERILHRAMPYTKPVWLLAGRASDTEQLLHAGFAKVESITPQEMETAEAVKPDIAKANIRLWTEQNRQEILRQGQSHLPY